MYTGINIDLHHLMNTYICLPRTEQSVVRVCSVCVCVALWTWPCVGICTLKILECAESSISWVFLCVCLHIRVNIKRPTHCQSHVQVLRFPSSSSPLWSLTSLSPSSSSSSSSSSDLFVFRHMRGFQLQWKEERRRGERREEIQGLFGLQMFQMKRRSKFIKSK